MSFGGLFDGGGLSSNLTYGGGGGSMTQSRLLSGLSLGLVNFPAIFFYY